MRSGLCFAVQDFLVDLYMQRIASLFQLAFLITYSRDTIVSFGDGQVIFKGFF